jgi:maltooligosyltrehalose trehalohydrolase
VLPYAPNAAYGTPDDLKALVDAAHDHGLMIFLDVVYNHFGPDGNYLSLYAPQFFREDRHTPWGAAIDFRRPEVRGFFTDNVLHWLMDYRFDGLRFDAVHAILDQDWVDEMAATVRATVEPGRHVHLVLEHHNDALRLGKNINAQWNDDGHNVMHVLLTGEDSGYYLDYADQPAWKLARCLAEGFVYQGEHSHYMGEPRGMPSGHLPPTAFVLFLQNHDQVGNRAFGERLTTLVESAALEAAIGLLMLSPQIPLLFMGEEWGSQRPFPFFCDFAPPLDEAVREGRRREFAHYPEFADPEAQARIPDPTAEATFAMARLDWSECREKPHARWLDRYRRLLAIRRREIVPRLDGIHPGGTYRVLGPAAVRVEWPLGDGSRLVLLANIADMPVPLAEPVDQGRMIYCSAAPPGDALMPHSAAFYLLAAR